MKIDNIPKPISFWYELEDGSKSIGVPDGPRAIPKNWKYQHSVNLEVSYSICAPTKSPKWPIKILNWIIAHAPNEWRGNYSQIYCDHSTINHDYLVIKYLVEQRKWSFHDACIALANLCSRCNNICSWECEGDDNYALQKQHLSTMNTQCEYCQFIDPNYYEQNRIKHCYKTMKKGGNTASAYKNLRTYKKGDAEW